MRLHIVIPILSLSMAAACSRDGSKAQASTDGTRTVKTEAVRAEDIRRPIELVGTLTADEEVTVSAETEGKVARVIVDLGDRVTAGQVLLELDREKLQYRVDQQRAALARARARYGVDEGATTFPALAATPDVQRAAAERDQAEQAFRRADELNRKSLLPSQQRDDAEMQFKAKTASYEAALQNAKNLRADVDAAEANLRLAERELRDAQVRAPFDGLISKRLASPGEYLKVQAPVVSMVRIDPLKLTAEVPERLAPWVKIGQSFVFTVEAYPDATMTGTIARLSPAVNTNTRAFPVEGLVPNKDGRLKPGTFARVRIESGRIDRVLTLPAAALQYRYGVNRVFMVAGDKLAAREIRIGDRLGDRVEVIEGLKAGDRVAVSDIEKLADGLSVRVTEDR